MRQARHDAGQEEAADERDWINSSTRSQPGVDDDSGPCLPFRPFLAFLAFLAFPSLPCRERLSEVWILGPIRRPMLVPSSKNPSINQLIQFLPGFRYAFRPECLFGPADHERLLCLVPRLQLCGARLVYVPSAAKAQYVRRPWPPEGPRDPSGPAGPSGDQRQSAKALA